MNNSNSMSYRRGTGSNFTSYITGTFISLARPRRS